MFMELPPPIATTKWEKIKYWLWYNLYYKWSNKYRWWKVKKSILNGKFFEPFRGLEFGIKINDIVVEQQMTYIKDTKLDWQWVKPKENKNEN